MKILLFSKYGQKAASFRYRFQQYFPVLEREGVQYSVSYLFDDLYLEKKFKTGRTSILFAFQALLRRLGALARITDYDLVIIHCELVPYFPPILEWYLSWKKVPYVIDFDDAIFHSYDINPSRSIRWLLGNKIRTIISRASYVMAGNLYLAEYARQVNQQVVILPTVLDLERYSACRWFAPSPIKKFTIGWIGSPSTAQYVLGITHILKKFCDKYNAQIILIGSGHVKVKDLPLEVREWSEATEVKDILDFDVGIMPLTDSPWSRGKCGFKLLQYMACGLPVIASAVGVNQQIVEEGVNGYLATTDDDWMRALENLISNQNMMKSMGRAGRKKIEAEFSLEIGGPIFISSIRKALSSACDHVSEKCTSDGRI
jgi:glycosyltransferase involved in cell wall biosynthesis